MTVTAPTFVSVSQNLTTGTGTANLPTGWQADDIVVYSITQCNTTPTAPTTPTGWNTYTGSVQGTVGAGTSTNIRMDCYWRRMVAGDTAPSISGAAGNKFTTAICIRGCRTDIDPLDISTGGQYSSVTTSWSCALGSTSTDNCLILYLFGTEASTTSAPVGSPSNSSLSSLTERYNTSFSTNSGTGRAQFTGILASAGDSGTFTGTTTSGYAVWSALALMGIDSGGATVLGGRTTLLGAGI